VTADAAAPAEPGRWVVAVGDALIDEVHDERGVQRHVGGAALNLSVALAGLDVPTGLVARIGADGDGGVVADCLAATRVTLVSRVRSAVTPVVVSERRSGEPVYRTNDEVALRRIDLTPEERLLLERARVVAVNYAIDDEAQARVLGEVFGSASGLRVLDPNPRPGMTRDPGQLVDSFARLVRQVDLVKVSRDDLAFLRGSADDAAARSLLEEGPRAVLLTQGADGATLFTASGSVHAPVPPLTAPVLDPMGAGDAALAGLVAGLLAQLPATVPGTDERAALAAVDWRAPLQQAMALAGQACQRAGGALTPASWRPADAPSRDAAGSDTAQPPHHPRG
jgi:fructokinase